MRSHHNHHAYACNLETAAQIDTKGVSGGRVSVGMVRGLHKHNENSLTSRLRKIKRANVYAISLQSSFKLVDDTC